jgi:hypothetical protein
MVVQQGVRIVLAGIAIGLAAAFGLTWLMASLLFDVKPTDPTTFGAVTLIYSPLLWWRHGFRRRKQPAWILLLHFAFNRYFPRTWPEFQSFCAAACALREVQSHSRCQAFTQVLGNRRYRNVAENIAATVRIG